MFHSCEDVLGFLDSLGLFSMDMGLDRMRRAIDTLHLDAGDWRPYIVQVVGTNGKGSTSTFLDALGRAHGVKTGLYTSPHFVTPRERIRINGEMIPAASLPRLANYVHEAVSDLTYFEFLTVLALLAFREAGVQLVVMEAGLGGRYDATTAMRADAVCFTPIDMDHMKILGDTLADIAADKACAIRENTPALTGAQAGEVIKILRTTAEARQSPLLLSVDVAALPKEARLGLAGPHQRGNALLALAAWTLAASEKHWQIQKEAVLQGLASARIPGRFQHVPASGGEPAFILDGGHNPHGLQSCLAALEAEKIRPGAMIFSCLADKDISSMLPIAAAMARGIPLLLCTIRENERAMPAEELAAAFKTYAARHGVGPSRILVFPSLAPALAEAGRLMNGKSAPVVICGSLYLLGEFFTLRPQWLSDSPQPSPR